MTIAQYKFNSDVDVMQIALRNSLIQVTNLALLTKIFAK